MFYNLNEINALHPLFQALENCRGHTQREDYHPEKCLFSHSLQVLNHALRESADIDCIFAAMIHDVGKQLNTLGHDQYSCAMLKGYISEKTNWLVSQHIRVKYLLSGELKKKEKVLYLKNHEWFTDLIMLNRWDIMGRNPNYVINYDRVSIMERIRNATSKSIHK